MARCSASRPPPTSRRPYPKSRPTPPPRCSAWPNPALSASSRKINPHRTFVLRYINAMTTALERFTPATREWFQGTFAAPTAAQEQGWAAIAQAEHTLILAPTGSGKTLAAFLWCLDRLASEPQPAEPKRRCRVLYVSPMKALAHDVERNLKAPLVGIGLAAQRLGQLPPTLAVAIRTGATTAA